MPTPTRNQVFAALFALTATLESGGTFKLRSRKFRIFAEVTPESQPAFFQTEWGENETRKRREPAKRTWRASWVVYLASDKNDPADQPTVRVNDLIDALEDALDVGRSPVDQTQTLGGLVEDVWIEGEIVKVPGDEDGQGMIVVPLSILVP